MAGSGHLFAQAPGDSWMQPRTMEQFAGLLKRSPFTLPTAEESSPLAERFALTGAYALDGEQVVFVIDKTTQSREKVTLAPNATGLRLVEYLPDADPRKMRATIRLGEQTATISFQESATPAAPNQIATNPGAFPPHGRTGNAPPPPNSIPVPMANTPVGQPRPTPAGSKRVIRRTVISGTSASKP